MRLSCLFVLAVSMSLVVARPEQGLAQSGTNPKQRAEDLLAADRGFAAANKKMDAIGSVSAMLSADVIMPVPGKGFAKGKDAVLDAIRAQPGFESARLEWTPFGVGVSTDGNQGYTFGFMDVHQADGKTVPLKYLAYWQREGSNWRVIAYKRGRRAEGAHSKGPGPMVLPDSRAWAGSQQVAQVDRAQGLAAAEREFSDMAQKIGLGPAFAEFGTRDSMNLGGPASADFVFGADAIAKVVSEGQPVNGSTVSWAADERVVVSDMGDLGLSVGFIRLNGKAEDGTAPPPIPFFTIWRRAAPDQPWRYIAE